MNPPFSYDQNDQTPEAGSFTDLANRVNASSTILGISEKELYDTNNPGGAAYTAEVGELLMQIVLEAESDVSQMTQLDKELGAYHSMLSNYVVLIKLMRQTHGELSTAVRSDSPVMPDVIAVLEAAIRVKASLNTTTP